MIIDYTIESKWILLEKSRSLYMGMVTRNRTRGHGPILFTREEFYEWFNKQPNIKEIYINWVNSDFNSELVPSVDRLDNTKGYSFDNIKLTTWEENKSNYMNYKKKIIQFDLEGNRIAIYNSSNEAYLITGGSRNGISETARGKFLYTGGNIWIFEEDYTEDKLKEIVNKIQYQHNQIPIYQVDIITGEIINEYAHANEAKNKGGFDNSTIGRILKGINIQLDGYFFIDKREYSKEKIKELQKKLMSGRGIKPIYIYRNGNKERFNSLNEFIKENNKYKYNGALKALKLGKDYKGLKIKYAIKV